MAARRPTRSLPLVALAAVAACVPPGDSGSLGTFAVTASLGSNTCGAQSGTFQSTVAFNVGVSAVQGVLKWSLAGATPTTGSYDPTTGAFELEVSDEVQLIAPDPRHQITGCILDRTDVIQGVLTLTTPDAGSPAVTADAGATVDTGVAGTVADGGPAPMDGGNPAVDGGTDGGVYGGVDVPVVPIAVTTLTGTETIVYGATQGSDCTALIGAAPGSFTVLPCTAVYGLAGTGH